MPKVSGQREESTGKRRDVILCLQPGVICPRKIGLNLILLAFFTDTKHRIMKSILIFIIHSLPLFDPNMYAVFDRFSGITFQCMPDGRKGVYSESHSDMYIPCASCGI